MGLLSTPPRREARQKKQQTLTAKETPQCLCAFHRHTTSTHTNPQPGTHVGLDYTAAAAIAPLLSLSPGDGVVHTRAGGRAGRHAAACHALEHALELGRAVREAVAPEAVAGVLDELDERDQEPPLFVVGQRRRRRGGQRGGGQLRFGGSAMMKPNSTNQLKFYSSLAITARQNNTRHICQHTGWGR